MTSFPAPYAAARIAAFLDDHLSWSAWWDKRYGLWRVAEDDIDSDLYAESRDADAVLRYMRAHSRAESQIHPGAGDSGRHRAYGDRCPPSSRGQGSRRSSVDSLKLAIDGAWIVVGIYWLASAAGSKQSVRGGWRTRLTGVSTVGVFVIAGVLSGSSLAVHSWIVAAAGAVLFAGGIALAIWARLHLGRDWGMPMTQRAEPELVTSGPYRFVRHPIYSGFLAAMLGTALVNSLLGLIVVAVMAAYFYYSGTVEERNLTATFPTAYPEYKSRTKMLIPFLL